MATIILAATEIGGMGHDYFEKKTRHLLPLANKPLIQHLIETTDKCRQTGKKYIIIEERVEENERKKPSEEVYNLIFGERIGKDIELAGQAPFQVGTFEAVRGYIDKNKKFPLLVLYGDTLVKENFLDYLIKQYLDENEKSKIVWGLVTSKKKRGKFVITKQEFREKSNGFWKIEGSEIINIFEEPVIRTDEP